MATCDSDRLSWPGHSIVLANSLYRLYAQSCLLDVRLVCDEAHIYAHKAVLSAGSQFFLEHLQSLGPGMVELQMSTANLGILISPNDLRAVVEYMYCGELLVPHHRLPHVLALVRSLQVFGFQGDAGSYIAGPEAQYLTHTEMNYASLDTSGLLEIPTDSSHMQLERTGDGVCGLGDSTSIPLVTVKPHEQSILQDPPKYSEPLKIDTNMSTLNSSSNMSFSELCTAPGTDGDAFTIQCNQMKNNIPSVFESSVLEETTSMFKSRPSECSEAYSKPDSDVVYRGTVLSFRGEPDTIIEGGKMINSALEEYGKEECNPQLDSRQASTSVLEGDTDDAYNTVMLLEALAADASSPSVMDMDSILLADEAKMTVSPRWLRSRRSLRATADSRVRLKVKDSIGGVSLQDTSQRQSAVSSSLPSVSSPEDETNFRDNKESWMVVLPEARTPAIPHISGANTVHTEASIADIATLPQITEPPVHVQSSLANSSLLNRVTGSSTVPLIASPMPIATSLLAQTSCPSSMSMFTHPSVSNNNSLLAQSSLHNPTTLLTQSNISFTPYLQPSVLSTAIVNQSDISHVPHALPTVPLQAVSVQSVVSEIPISYPQNVTYSQSTSPIFTQSSPSPAHTLTQTSSVHPHVHSPDSRSSPLSESSVSILTPVTHSDKPTSIAASLFSSPFSQSSPTSVPILTQSSGSSALHFNVSDRTILQSSASSNSPLNQSAVSSPVLAVSSVSTTPLLLHPSSSSSPLILHSPIASTPPVYISSSSSSLHSSSVSNVSCSTSDTVFPLAFTSSHAGLSPTVVSLPNSSHVSHTTTSPTDTSVSCISSASKSNSYKTISTTSSTQSISPSVSSASTTITSNNNPSTVSACGKNTSASLNTITLSTNDGKSLTTPSSTAPCSPGAVSEEGHSGSEEEDAHRCSQCPRSFRNLDKLTLHLWKEHEIGTVARCQLCEFSTPLHSSLVQHATSHITKECNTCAICNKKFKTRATVKTHLRVHRGEEVMYKCESCPMMYSQKFNLIKHLASKHERDAEGRPLTQLLTCPYCAFTTLADYKLKTHMVRRHTVDKPFKCNHCTYATTEKTALAKHMRTHTKERPYVCETCGFHAPTLSSLWRHRRSHTGEKPFECELCGQLYADSKRLRDHMYKHNNVKPFMCHMCGYTYRRKDNLQTHLHKIHKTEDKKDSGVQRTHATALTKSGKSKREKRSLNQPTTNSLKSKSEVTQDQDSGHITCLDDVKIKMGPEVSKLQVWSEHSYDTRSLAQGSDGESLMIGSTAPVMGCGGEVDTNGSRELMASHTPFTATLAAPTLQSSGCVAIGGTTPTLQLGYLLPITAPPEPTITLTSSTDGVILVGQSEVSNTSKPFQ